MQNKMGQVRESFSKNTYYRFLMNPRTNWLRFTTLLSEKIMCWQHISEKSEPVAKICQRRKDSQDP